MRRMKFWGDLIAIVGTLATIIAICFAGYQFLLYRSAVESVVMTIRSSVVYQDGQHYVYVDVELQNVGNVKIKGRSETASLMPMVGENDLLPQPMSRTLGNLSADDPEHVYTIDKGEVNTFSFAFALPKNPAVTACRIESRYESMQITDEGKPLTWLRGIILPIAPVAKASTPAPPSGAD